MVSARRAYQLSGLVGLLVAAVLGYQAAALPYYTLGFEGARLLEAVLSGKAVSGKREIDCPLVFRQSAGPASREREPRD